MQCPKLLGKSSKVKFSTVVDTISNNIGSYILAYPFSGVNTDYSRGKFDKNNFYEGPDFSLGSNYFYKTSRICEEDSDIQCRGKEAWVYLRNIPTGKIPLLNNISFTELTGCDLSILSQRGLIPGMLEDLSDLSPMNLIENIQEKGNVVNRKCKLVTYPEGTHIYDNLAKGRTWDNVTKCSVSYNHLKDTTDISAPFKIPGSKPLFEGFNDFSLFVPISNSLIIFFILIICFCLISVLFYFYTNQI